MQKRQKKRNIMKATFNYTYNKRAITAAEFNKNVPDDWQDNLNEYFVYSWGAYKATLVDDEVVVDKSDFEIENYLGGYHSIKGRLFGKEIEVLGGDSANEDDYDRDFFEKVYEEWDGRLINDCGQFRIELP